MMRKSLTLATLALASPAVAEDVRVLSGEHGRFTRLAMVLDERTDWQFGRVDGGYELRLGRSGVNFLTDRIYDRIARRRISDVALNGEALRLTLGCDECHPHVFEDRPGLIVIDVRDGAAPDDSPFEQALIENVPQPAETPARRPAAPQPRRPDDLARDLSLFWRNDAPPAPQAEPQPEPALPAEATERVQEAQDLLVRKLAEAASQGFVELAPVLPEPDPVPETSVEEALAPPQVRMRARTALDREVPAIIRNVESPRDCLSDQDLDVSAWGNTETITSDLALARSAHVGEGGSAAETLQLARLYLYLGFGAEAQQILSAAPRTPEATALAGIAAVIDAPVSRTPPETAGMTSCDTSAALWAALGIPSSSQPVSLNGTAIARAFSDLPPHLRRHLGSRLVDALLRAGNPDAAGMVRNAMGRTSEPSSSVTGIVDARIALANGHGEAATAHLLTEGAEATPEGLALFLEARLRHGESIELAHVEAAAAFATELGQSGLGPKLSKLHALGLAATGAFEAALSAYQKTVPSAKYDAQLLDYLVASAPDSLFLGAVYEHPQLLDTAATPTGRQATAERLLGLGFPELALRVLNNAPQPLSGDRLLLARAALLLRNPQVALAHLAGLSGAEAAILRGEAHEMLGQPEAASAAYLEADANADLVTRLWRNGSIEAATALSEGARGEAMRALEASSGNVPSGGTAAFEASLAESRALLANSQEERAMLEALLASFALPEQQPQ
ncbi:hypothetical protein [Halodurantibacterium flavum]|uniref:HEAT repeat domain-containing protein n=1 Tax=Halodurantibacterium flavum TaxID=1382802 RepID=A0ABW4S8A2_9RHOB